ncbi:MAG: HAD family phosphatase [Clostridia bacterium]|nr:HAD family phosphatase [Clostridia bacterium]
MIKNIVFDFGNVLIKYDPTYIVSQYVSDPEDLKLIVEVLFDRLYWDKLDDDTITDEELVRSACARMPERLHEISKEIYYAWPHHLPAIPGMWELVRYVKEKYGVKTYLLSNVGSYFVKFKDEFSVFSAMENCIFSATAGHSKPNRDMYEYLLETCGIAPEETFFVDDNEKNIAAAREFGIDGYVFDGDVAALKTKIEKILEQF